MCMGRKIHECPTWRRKLGREEKARQIVEG
jgi:hypothetical protein